MLNRGDGGRVAGDDDEGGPLCHEEISVLADPRADLLERFVSVGTPSGIPEVDQGMTREKGSNLLQDGEPAHAGVKDANGIGHAKLLKLGEGRWERRSFGVADRSIKLGRELQKIAAKMHKSHKIRTPY